MKQSPWSGREIVIATMHGKEKVLGQLMQDNFDMSYSIPRNFNTDSFGTFSGERVRELSALETARMKCLAAIEHCSVDLGLASEGSFGPHPELGFIHINEEFLILIDKKNNWEITAKKVSTDTNFARQLIENEEELTAFAASVGFPSHGLILRTDDESEKIIVKGICEPFHLLESFRDLQRTGKKISVETDMRALFNPKRMNVIAQAGSELVSRMLCTCEKCQTPGFGPVRAVKGLPCSSCGFPTSSTMYLVRQCAACGFNDQYYYPNGFKFEEPQYCNYCNP